MASKPPRLVTGEDFKNVEYVVRYAKHTFQSGRVCNSTLMIVMTAHRFDGHLVHGHVLLHRIFAYIFI